MMSRQHVLLIAMLPLLANCTGHTTAASLRQSETGVSVTVARPFDVASENFVSAARFCANRATQRFKNMKSFNVIPFNYTMHVDGVDITEYVTVTPKDPKSAMQVDYGVKCPDCNNVKVSMDLLRVNHETRITYYPRSGTALINDLDEVLAAWAQEGAKPLEQSKDPLCIR